MKMQSSLWQSSFLNRSYRPLYGLWFWGWLAFAGATWGNEPVRLSAQVFGASAEVEVRDLPRPEAVAAAQAALSEIFEVGNLLDPQGRQPGSLGYLNQAAGLQAVLVEDRVADILVRSLQYCFWSSGAHGPMGAGLYHLWGSAPIGKVPAPIDLRREVENAECRRLSLIGDRSEPEGMKVKLPAESQVFALGAQRGFAIDRAVTVLEQLGVKNAWVEIGSVFRAMGPGPDGQGWLFELPAAPGADRPLDQIFLQDQALAMVGVVSPQAGGKKDAATTRRQWIDQRTGVPSRGVILVVTAAPMALDAEVLATSLYITGLRDGQRRLGALEPRPSVYWLLGERQSTQAPLESTYHWSRLRSLRTLRATIP